MLGFSIGNINKVHDNKSASVEVRKNDYNLQSESTAQKQGKEYTHPKVESDLLMFVASFRRSPSAPELFCL